MFLAFLIKKTISNMINKKLDLFPRLFYLLIRLTKMPRKVSPEERLKQTRNNVDLGFFDLYSIDQARDQDLNLIFKIARVFRDCQTHKFDFCKGKSQINLFLEASTRTQSSFDLAAKHLGMDTTSVSGSTSSVTKGESFLDTMMTLDSFNPAVIVLRSDRSGLAEILAPRVKAAVINAGDGWHEHPTQGLLDALTMLDHFKVSNLKGIVVTIIGDILHSRVFGSLVRILNKLQATIRVAAPLTFIPEQVEKFGLKVFTKVEEALKGADVAYVLRVQEERGAKGDIPNLREYSKTFSLSEKRLKIANKNAIVMHPGPVIRGTDVHSVLAARHPQSRVLIQVENGLAIRKTLIWLLADRMDGKNKSVHKL
jgi:aspartate carbamoyltransferase catalytic subunit